MNFLPFSLSLIDAGALLRKSARKRAFPWRRATRRRLALAPASRYSPRNPERGRCFKTPLVQRRNLPDSEVLSRLNSGAVAQYTRHAFRAGWPDW